MNRILAYTGVLLLIAGLALADDTGTIRITNRDATAHSLEIDQQQRILHIYPGTVERSGAVTIPAGGVATVSLAVGPWSVYGDGSSRFTVMISRRDDYEFTLQPFTQTNAYGGVSHGLLGLIDDGYNQSSYQLFALAEAPPTVVVQPAPAPAPVVVVPSPSYYYPPVYYRRDEGRELGEAIGSAVFDILGNVLSDDNDHHHRRHDRDRW